MVQECNNDPVCIINANDNDSRLHFKASLLECMAFQ
jgi:hypothetical protein